MRRDIFAHVEQKHIDAGKKKSCFECPVALAINEHLKPGYRYLTQNQPLATE